jgi:hypothetical protein
MISGRIEILQRLSRYFLQRAVDVWSERVVVDIRVGCDSPSSPQKRSSLCSFVNAQARPSRQAKTAKSKRLANVS